MSKIWKYKTISFRLEKFSHFIVIIRENKNEKIILDAFTILLGQRVFRFCKLRKIQHNEPLPYLGQLFPYLSPAVT